MNKGITFKAIVLLPVVAAVIGVSLLIVGANSDEEGSPRVENPNPVLANMLPPEFYFGESYFSYKDVWGRGIHDFFKDKKLRKISLLQESWSNISPEEGKELQRAHRELRHRYGDANARGEAEKFNMRAKSDEIDRKIKPEGIRVISLSIWITDSYDSALMIARDHTENMSTHGYKDPKTKKFKRFMPSPGSFSGQQIGNLCWTRKRADPPYSLPEYASKYRSFAQGGLGIYLVKNNIFARVEVSHRPYEDYLVDPAFVEEVAKKVASKF